MKVSLNTLRFINQHYGSAGDPASNGVDDLVQKIGAQLGAVEEVTPFGERFNPVIIVRVVSCEDHPNADRLHVCKIDDGGKAEGIERDENGHIQVVCGAPNVRAGMMAAWLPPGTTVPSTFYDVDSFVLEARDLRGVVSNGMLASPKELALSDSHEGILEITQDSDEHVQPGTLFVDAYHLRNDIVIDMENKMFTHRPDCFGWLGIAREIEGIYNRPYKSPEWYRMDPAIPEIEAEELPLEVQNDIPALVPRFTAIVVRDVEVKPSPVWLQVDLAKVGLRPINNIVDYTNFYMLETGQPIHAYDYDKVRVLSNGDAARLVIRHPREGEQITLLNGKTITPRAEAMMVATDQRLVCVGGAMGGTDTEVDEHTKHIIIEAANWDMYSMRRTSMEHGIFTDAVTRFTKGQSPLQNVAIVAKMVDEVRRFAGGKVASKLVDVRHLQGGALERGNIHPPVTVTRGFINARLGFDLSVDDMRTLLTNVEFVVEQHDDELTITAPFWRTDIAIPEDIVEEVGRLYGYDHLPLELPERDIAPAARDTVLELKRRVREALSKAGAHETLLHTFVHGNVLTKSGQDISHAFQVGNALSPDLQYYRLSITPSLLTNVHPNIKTGHNQFALFEINKVHAQTEVDDEGLPAEFMRVGLVFASEDKTASSTYSGAPYYQARAYFMHLLDGFGQALAVHFAPLHEALFEGHPLAEQMARPFEPNRSAVIYAGDRMVGVVGEYRASVRKAFKLPAYSAGFELFASMLLTETKQRYMQLPRFPKVEQDICLKVPATLTYQELFSFVWTTLERQRPERTYHMLGPVDIYQRPDDTDYKQITLRLTIASYERTLTDEEVSTMLDDVAQAAHEQVNAERV